MSNLSAAFRRAVQGNTATELGRAVAASEMTQHPRDRTMWTREQLMDLFFGLKDRGWMKRGASFATVEHAHNVAWLAYSTQGVLPPRWAWDVYGAVLGARMTVGPQAPHGWKQQPPQRVLSTLSTRSP